MSRSFSALLLTFFKVFAVFALLILVWSATLKIFAIRPFFMPSPTATFETMWERRADLKSAAFVTLRASFTGLFLATIVSTILSALVVKSISLARTFVPLAIVLRTIPVIAVAPLIALVVGRGFKTSVIAVMIVTFFPIFAYLAEGLKATSKELRELMRLYDATFFQSLTMLRIPVSLPFLFAGIQDAARVAVLAAMLAEWLTGTDGLGVELSRAASARRSDMVWSVVIIATGLSIGLFYLSRAVEIGARRRLVM